MVSAEASISSVVFAVIFTPAWDVISMPWSACSFSVPVQVMVMLLVALSMVKLLLPVLSMISIF